MSHPDPSIRDGIIAHLKRYHPAQCRRWFEEIEVAAVAGGVLMLHVDEALHYRYLERECTGIFQEAAQAVTGRLISVRFTQDHLEPQPVVASADTPRNTNGLAVNIEPKIPSSTGTASPALTVPQSIGDPSSGTMYDDMVINPDYSFDSFIVGPSTRLAHAAAVAVSDQPGVSYNPFFVHGGVGLGKTHLLQAICRRVLERTPDARIYYVSCEGFTSQFMEAVQAGQMLDFRHRFRHMDILVVDDIHFLAGHDRTQEEFFHTFNSLYQARKQIILSSDAAPEEIPKLEDRLLSRFKSGLVARVDMPCYETRVAILRNKAALRGLKIADEVVCYVAQRSESNIRELEGALTQLQAMAMATGRPIDLDLAREAVGDDASTATTMVSIQAIIAAVSSRFEVKPADLLSKRRHQSIAYPRQIAMYLARRNTRHSLQEIGGFFGGRDHTTVMHAVSKIAGRRDKDQSLHQVINILEHELTSTPR